MCGGCASNAPVSEHWQIDVLSLSDYWPRIEAVLLDWHPDAYLVEVSLSLYVNDDAPLSPLILAFFYSQSFPGNALEVYVDEHGIVETVYFDYDPDFDSGRIPILRSDWTVDSTTALEKLMSGTDAGFIVQHAETQCSDLHLARWPDDPRNAVLWRLRVYECLSEGYDRVSFLDAMSGQVVELP
jgi:hypothetical protein